MWLAIGGARHHLVIERDRFRAGDIFRGDDSHRRTDMCQHQLARHITDGVNVFNIGLHLLVDLDKAALANLDADFFESESL